jgi:hypothetical protein
MRIIYGILVEYIESKRQFGTPGLIRECNFNKRGYYYYYTIWMSLVTGLFFLVLLLNQQ